MLNQKRRLALQIVFSILIVYHLAAMVILPNSSSLLGRKVSSIFLPYANSLALNTAWVFFSPGPAPMYHLQYEIHHPVMSVEDVDRLDGDPDIHQYPPERTSIFDDGYNRRLYEMRFFSVNEERLRTVLVPYICKIHPEAESISIQSIVERVQDIEKPGEYADFKELSDKTELPRQQYSCLDARAGANQ